MAAGARIAGGQTATDDRIGTLARSKSGRANTTCRTSTSRSTFRISASNTSSTGATVTRTSRSSQNIIAAATRRASRGRDSRATDAAAAAGGVADAASIRASPRNSYDSLGPARPAGERASRSGPEAHGSRLFDRARHDSWCTCWSSPACSLSGSTRAFTGLAHGQKTHDFLAKLVRRGYATIITPGALHRGRLYHVQVQAALRGHRRAEQPAPEDRVAGAVRGAPHAPGCRARGSGQRQQRRPAERRD